METMVSPLTARVATQYSLSLQVEAVALAGSHTNSASDAHSDIDLYVYLSADLPVSDRRAVASKFTRRAEVDNNFWEPSDAWIDEHTSIRVDVMFRRTDWIEAQLTRVLDEHQASVGYSTCFWHNLLSSQILFDRRGWLRALQATAQRPYPEELRQAVVAKNFPILRHTLSAYTRELEHSVRRGDRVSTNHRVAALLASYFDVVFAINSVPHPGEKRLVQLAEARCDRLPDKMSEQVDNLISAVSMSGDEVCKCAHLLIDGLEVLLRAEGLLDSRGEVV
ncbi:DUF4037 domain-containing protein [Phormidium tenue]|uniref:DUF4037 domain-containing protein n=1 Tax=Phormidium tenue NIES-30 TaxID=549789 RepID=A0A1U7J8Q0_9CYAN|nr:DUF4037 domain-containing protein [Phormidium tenue]MBD2231089.1 DUF4037 domain-containing protein [Phormidium tenue FACHB-1052]OKH49883.1 hypothetical protein NIES30_03990 [Phormidium tenue NIES-30]